MTYDRRSFLQKLAAAAALLALGGRSAFAATASALPANMEMAIKFAIAPATTSGRYHKPYTAVWIETPTGEYVRTVSLWRTQGQKGTKWLKDLRQWFRTASTPDTVSSSATRGPGSYEVVWDGNDEKGKRVGAGEYVVLVEAAREKGPYQRVRVPITLGSKPAQARGTGSGDLGDVSVEYRTK